MGEALAGRVAVVTGAGSRLGRVISEALLEAGADLVAGFHTHREGADALVEQAKALGRRAVAAGGDLTDSAAVERLFEAAGKLGGCDLLINSAGIFERRPVESIDDASWRRMIDTNLSAPFFCCRAAAASMRRKGRGDIVNLLDVGGALLPWRGYAHYCASKAGLAMLTKCLALELAPAIRVNGVAPGPVTLPEGFGEAETRRAIERVPLRRVGSPQDVVQTVLFLLTGPSYVTGQILAVDGGRSIG
jgi:pteridine reductase